MANDTVTTAGKNDAKELNQNEQKEKEKTETEAKEADDAPIPDKGTKPASNTDDNKGPVLCIRCCLWTSLTESKPEAKLAYKAGPVTMLETGTLDSVRRAIHQMKTKAAKDIGDLSFCDKTGAVMEDGEHLGSYFSMNGETVEKGKGANFTAYLRKDRDAIAAGAAKEGLGSQLTASEKLREVMKHVKPEDLKHLDLEGLFKDDEYRAKAGDLDKAADMTETDWSVVMRNNALLCGYVIQAMSSETAPAAGKEAQPVIRSIRRAPYPTFTLKPRTFASYEISNAAEGKNQTHHIPHWQQDDFSYVSVTETDSAMKESLAKSGFSDWDVSASGSGSAFGFSVAASVSVSGSKSTATSTDTETVKKKLTVAYNFPRVRVILDPESLEVSPECRADLAKITSASTATDVYRFQQKYGAFFPTDVQLGGRLHSTTEKGSFKTAEGSDEMNTFKSSAAASFSTPTGAGGSVGAGYSQESQTHSQSAKAQSDVAIMWEATGGNTLLANSPPDWCPTVGSFYNWRIVKQESVVPLIHHIGLIGGFADKAKIVEDILVKKGKADMKEQRDALLKEQEKLLTAKSVVFELNLSSLSGSANEDGSKWTMLYPQSASNITRRSTMFFEVSGTGINWAKSHGYQSEVSSIETERDYYLRHGTDVQWHNPKKIPGSWSKSTQKFIAKTEDGQIVEQLFYNTKYQIYDESGKYRLNATKWSGSTLEYAFATFIDAAHVQRKTFALFQTPGGNKAEGRITSDTEVEMQIFSEQGSGRYPGLYCTSPSEWYRGAAISWDDIVKTRGWQTVNIYNFKINTFPEVKSAKVASNKT